jgi:hypothetical protein
MNRKCRTSTHHVFPRSRFPEYADAWWNLRTVKTSKHQAYHLLFENMAPCEAALKLLLEFGPEDFDDLPIDPGLESLRAFLGRVKGRGR